VKRCDPSRGRPVAIEAAIRPATRAAARDSGRLHASLLRPAPVVPCHPAWQPGQAELAAAGGAGRRSAQRRGRADGSIARSAPLGAAAPFPRGGPVGRGVCGRLAPRGALPAVIHRPAGVGYAGRMRRVQRRGSPARANGCAGSPGGRVGLRSLPAEQHAPPGASLHRLRCGQPAWCQAGRQRERLRRLDLRCRRRPRKTAAAPHREAQRWAARGMAGGFILAIGSAVISPSSSSQS